MCVCVCVSAGQAKLQEPQRPLYIVGRSALHFRRSGSTIRYCRRETDDFVGGIWKAKFAKNVLRAAQLNRVLFIGQMVFSISSKRQRQSFAKL